MLCELGASLVAQRVKNLPAMQETQVHSLDQEDSLEKGKATRSSIPACRFPWTGKPGGLQSMGSQRVEHDWATNTMWTNVEGPWNGMRIGFLFLPALDCVVLHKSLHLSKSQVQVCWGKGRDRQVSWVPDYLHTLRTMAPLTYRDTHSSNPCSPKEINSSI